MPQPKTATESPFLTKFALPIANAWSFAYTLSVAGRDVRMKHTPSVFAAASTARSQLTASEG